MLGERLSGIVVSGFNRGPVQVGGFLLLRELAAQRGFYDLHVERDEFGHDADVDHVLDQLAQLGFRADGSGDLVEGNAVTDHVVAILLEVCSLFVDGDCARGQREDVFLGGLRIHGDEDVDLLLAGDVSVLAGANGVPGRQSRDVRWERDSCR